MDNCQRKDEVVELVHAGKGHKRILILKNYDQIKSDYHKYLEFISKSVLTRSKQPLIALKISITL